MRRLRGLWVPYLLVGLGAYAIFLVATLPAALVYDLWQGSAGPAAGVQASEIKGSVWRGSASGAQVAGLRLDSVDWEVRVLPLLIGRVVVDWSARARDSHARGTVARAWSGALHFQNLQGSIEGAALGPALGHVPVRLGGEFNLDVGELDYRPGESLRSQGRIAWSRAALTVPQALSLGDFQLSLEPAANGSRGVFSDRGGPLKAEGVVELTADNRYTVKAKLAARDSAAPELQAALSMLGRPNGQGEINVNWSGSLPGAP